MKKVLTTALLCTVSAFATWDYFPIKPAGKGEAIVGAQYFMQDKESVIGLNAGARFSVIEGLEIAALFNGRGIGGFPLTYSYDGDSCEDDYMDCPPSFDQPVIGLRYWLPMGVGIALDATLPFQGDFFGGNDAAHLAFTPAVQYSAKFTEQLEFGSQVSFSIPLEKNDVKPAKELGIGLELDCYLGFINPYVGVDVAMELIKEAGDKHTGIMPYAGVIFYINEMFSADAGVSFGIGKDYYASELSDKMPIVIGANFSASF